MDTSLSVGGKPLFLIHQSSRYWTRLPELFRSISSATKDKLEVGVVAQLPAHPPDKVKAFLEQFDSTIKIADPEVFRHRDNCHEGDKYDRRKSTRYYSYLKESLPGRTDPEWIRMVLKYQQLVGATILISPSILLRGSAPLRELERQIDWFHMSQDLYESDVAANFTIESSWISDPGLRTQFLNELVELTEAKIIYLRVLWPVLSSLYSQLHDASILQGYKTVVETLSAEGRIIILPTTSLTGLFCTALGATGFSMGMSSDQQAFAIKPAIRRPRGKYTIPRRSRYFERDLLHVVDLSYHELLTTTNQYRPCQCDFCAELNDNMRANGSWSMEAASLHYLFTVAQLTSNLGGRAARAVIRGWVRQAHKYLEGLPRTQRPQGDNVPRHLEKWEKLLA